jgi:hypothetical protein
VALAAVKGEKTLAELAAQYEEQAGRWRSKTRPAPIHESVLSPPGLSGALLVVRSPLSVPDSGVNRPTKFTASGARGLFGQGIGQ